MLDISFVAFTIAAMKAICLFVGIAGGLRWYRHGNTNYTYETADRIIVAASVAIFYLLT